MSWLQSMSMPNMAWQRKFRCHSIMMLQGAAREDADTGGKIFLPPDALEDLASRNVQYPMMFKLRNDSIGKETHAGVLEFTATPGHVYMPGWMMRNLLLQEDEIITVQNLSMVTCTYAKFQPQSPDFLDISNPKAVLENTLRKFSCLTVNDIIAINYNNKVYEIEVLEVKPENSDQAVSIVECDMQLEFAAPIGYKEPERVRPAASDAATHAATAQVSTAACSRRSSTFMLMLDVS
ncbi:uncharacterized protein MONBRDRAFT_18846 [Monosiga brevicollis MX1]|uniref:Uncharacterized protein n=1 Tax=Monosiga brevicollis TaxID=81824 RepID=A9UY07_MONBE|nr:uncharacterized protein MONBRDRAFT_18846 [Monosiga brevicollis MX1]EDQ89776.1 predicted protein [Monosiga brevicollis MX1]|eukprot:XP_001745198.1 hypothetical protein [Monosiga brevicollis MX1]